MDRFKLDYPEQVFDIDFFREKPEPFFELARELYPGKFSPTITHSFIRLLHEKNILLRCFTQNIDTLERRAGVPSNRIIEAHGSFAANHCISRRCGLKADADKTKSTILDKKIPRCEKCKSLVKPDIVFMGEMMPEIFFERMVDLDEADLLLVMGTSLQVQPFASLPDRVSRNCPRLLLNLEDVGHFSRELDVVNLVDCDTGCRTLAEACGWLDELEELDKQIKADVQDPGLSTVPVSESSDLSRSGKDPISGNKEPAKALENDHSSVHEKDDVEKLVERIKGTNL